MTETKSKPRPWMIAAWPGMGSVASIAGLYLVRELNMTEAEELPPGGHFDVGDVEARQGLISPVRLPRGRFFTWTNPGPGRDLVVFLAEAQPSYACLAYAEELLDVAQGKGVERVVTFASLACGLHPSEHPKVSGVATDASTLDELRRAEVSPIADGQIGGLNGLVLGAAAARGMAGVGLLAEIPFFAMRVANPKAARAALSVFSVLAGVDVSLHALSRQAAAFDEAMAEAMERMRRESEVNGPEELDVDGEGVDHQSAAPAPAATPPSAEDPAALARIEELFEIASRDVTHAVRLKQELDRQGVFGKYEERFLDLFRRAN
jgi:predicted ATP-grasp superfamily ATP-dependent carboligase